MQKLLQEIVRYFPSGGFILKYPLNKWMLLGGFFFFFIIAVVTNLAASLFVERLGAKIETSLPYSWAHFAVQIISLWEVEKALQ